MTKKVRKNKKNKNKFKVQKPLEGRNLPNIFNPDGTLNKFYKKSGGGVSERIKNIEAKEKKEMQEDKAKNRPSRNITGDRAKQRKRKKLVRDMMTAGMLGIGLGKKFGVENQFMQQQKPLGKVGKKTGDMILSPKADLDGDGMFSEYEKKRGMAVQKAMAENDKPVKVAQASQGGGIAIRGTKFKGVF